MRAFRSPRDYLEAVGGIANRPELIREGFSADRLRFAVQLGAIQHLCRGWYGSPQLPWIIREAWRSGGPLACVSALQFEGLITSPPESDTLHISRRTRGHRLRHAGEVIIHWSDDALHSGTRWTVSVDVAIEQARTCPITYGHREKFETLAAFRRAVRHDERDAALGGRQEMGR